MTIASRIHALQDPINQSIVSLDDKRPPVRLVAVSKGRNCDEIIQAMDAGVRDFGENYYQEALPKLHQLQLYGLCWHYLGRIQSNKTQGIAQHFDWVHGVCDLKHAQQLHQFRPEASRPLNVCIQVNLQHEASKAGVLPDEAPELAQSITALHQLRLRGLMVIPKADASEHEQLTVFYALSALLTQINQHLPQAMDTLSMGMTDDFKQAILAGSTLVRIGRGIFGERPQ